ncbi:integrator complex subunit 3 [Phoenix dactylifera]|uniref:Integrator complex subunit 3 n=1 Tax=Phoenix dactylifera TaxID=42345 RepID=A0A8B7CK24_PHODC|nr:integrator complex subunit 3 [Phoenix dactylifera]XP_008800647.2 integrator complex subunit 3-like [Phoenix dactylifera]XP_038989949.1 integrator complex subunit 3-like [Phoenix dactylifera]XP_038989970.1 integrator complex subunit 3 [Phoenix dactylifera]
MNSSKLLRVTAHEAENPTEVSLREAFFLLQPQLKPPFPLSIPSPSEYSQLNLAIAFGILTEPHLAKTHLTHLHAIVIDGYNFFTTTLLKLCNESYPKLLETPRIQILWLTSNLVQVAAVHVDSLIISLLRQTIGGHFSESNLWLCAELVKILSDNWDWILDEPLVLTSALFVYLRLLADHYRLGGSVKLDSLKRMEIDFCIKALRECFSLCLQIGRDLVRLLQDLVHIPEFRDVWKDLLFDPRKFQVLGFTDISGLYRMRTPAHYFLLRITPDMEAHLRFLLTYVNWGSQKRYQAWFAKKHLCWPGSETVIADIIRFICCSHHPPNEIIQSNIISRWAVVGWLLKSCRRNYFEANAKLALFYDWLFFDEKVDSIMNIEPAMLLMVNSVPKYVDLTHTLLEFLFLLVDNYDVSRKEAIVHGVSAALNLLVRKGVVRSLEPLTSCNLLSLLLRERLITFLPRSDPGVVKASSDTCSQRMVTDGEVAPVLEEKG